VASPNVDRKFCQHIPLSLALIEEEDIRLYESAKDEITILAKEAGFQEVSEDDV
jgi:hypothetical protein